MMSLEPVRARIVEFLEDHEEAAPKEIVAGLGDGVDAVLIRQALGRMVDAAILRKIAYGKYALCPAYDRRTKSVRSDTEELICALLRDSGGVAFTREIHKAVWGGVRGRGERPYDYNRVQRALRQSTRLKQSFGRGVWNLPEEELALVPMPGRWASLVLGQRSLEDRNNFFREVGGAFADARDQFTLGDMCADPVIAALLNQMVNRAPRALDKALGMKQQDSRRGEAEPLGAYLYWLFEQGDPELHMAAPSAFYNECARKFGANPATLSRGCPSET
jgi:hypothetical protein